MDRLTLAPQDLTPMVDLDPERGLLVFQGESYPENVLAFYRPVLDWIREYFSNLPLTRDTVLQISLRYMNTSSTKVFMMIFDLCQEAHERGRNITILWRHHKEDDLMREMGLDLKEGLGMPFVIEVED